MSQTCRAAQGSVMKCLFQRVFRGCGCVFRCKVLPIEFFFFFAQLLGVLRFMVLAGLKGREEASIYIYIYVYVYVYIYMYIYIWIFE